MENRQLYLVIGDWLEIYKKNSVKPLTYDRLVISYNLMRKYSIAAQPVDEIDCDDMQRYIGLLVNDGYSISTIKKQFNLHIHPFIRRCSRGDEKSPWLIAQKRAPACQQDAQKLEVPPGFGPGNEGFADLYCTTC